MPRDAHGQLHAGSIGLFDDDFEYRRPSRRAQRQERKRIERFEGAIRLDESNNNSSKRSKLSSNWLKRIFCGGRADNSYEAVPSSPVTEEKYRPKTGAAPPPYSAAPPAYSEEDIDIDAADSLWLRECGVVRLHSTDPVGCHILPRSAVQRTLYNIKSPPLDAEFANL